MPTIESGDRYIYYPVELGVERETMKFLLILLLLVAAGCVESEQKTKTEEKPKEVPKCTTGRC